ncbi:MAG TPA: TadE/TadG family type IV pilus assembly protein [Xanthobacteraceae bacterium]|jgi:Flp pilus assembly protein TadG
MMPAARPTISNHLSRLCRDQDGMSAVEFAMVLPLMLTLYLGAVEISQAVGVDRKVTLTSRTVADLASQSSSLASSDMQNILNASSAVIAPYDQSQLKVTVSEVNIDNNGNATIAWSCTLGGAAHAVGSAVTLPSGLKIANTSLIWGEAAYTYKPVIGYVVTGTLNLSDQIYMRPRLSNSVSGSC